MMGRGQPIYAMTLQAQLYQGEVPEGFQSPPVELLIYPFNLRVKRGLANLGDYGVMADVIQLRQGVVQDMELADQLL
jgi:hypothetical protein